VKRTQLESVSSHVTISSAAVRLAECVHRSREIAALLTATAASISQVQDGEVHQLSLAALEAVERLEARLQLLGEAYRIADLHQAADQETPALTEEMAEPLAVGISSAPVGVEGVPGDNYFLDGS